MTGLPKRALAATIALLLGLAPLLGLPALVAPPVVEAFYPDLHFSMFQQAIGGRFSDEAQTWVKDGLERNDAFPEGHKHSEWHFDSAKDSAAICALWMAHEPGKKIGPNKLLFDATAYAVEAFRRDQIDPPGVDRVGGFRREALILYGQYLHAIQDFYTHSNWIELHVAAGTQPGLAPIQAGCDAAELARLQPKLQSGYFDVTSAPADFCGGSYIVTPRLRNLLGLGLRPPAGYDYCHGPPDPAWYVSLAGSVEYPPELRLAKDVPNYYHGQETFQLPGGSVTTYHQEAVRLATLATTETLQVLHDRVVNEFKKQAALFPNRDPECLFTALIKGTNPACPKASLFNGNSAEALALAFWLRPVDVARDRLGTWTVRAFQAEVGLDPVTGKPVSGAMTVDLFSQENLDLGGGRYYRLALNGAGLTASTMSGDVGTLTFADPLTIYQTPPLKSELLRRTPGVAYTFSDAGQLVLCEGFSDTADPATQRKECLASTIAALDPASSPPA